MKFSKPLSSFKVAILEKCLQYTYNPLIHITLTQTLVLQKNISEGFDTIPCETLNNFLYFEVISLNLQKL